MRNIFFILFFLIGNLQAQRDSLELKLIHAKLDSIDYLLKTVYTEENYMILWRMNRDSSNKFSRIRSSMYNEYDSLFLSRYVRYTSIKMGMRNPEDIYYLDLSGKGLFQFPERILDFPNLEVLDLSGSEDFDHHYYYRPRKIQKVRCSKPFKPSKTWLKKHRGTTAQPREPLRKNYSTGRHNHISIIPYSIVQLSHLKRIYLDSNMKNWEWVYKGLKLLLPNCEVY